MSPHFHLRMGDQYKQATSSSTSPVDPSFRGVDGDSGGSGGGTTEESESEDGTEGDDHCKEGAASDPYMESDSGLLLNALVDIKKEYEDVDDDAGQAHDASEAHRLKVKSEDEADDDDAHNEAVRVAELALKHAKADRKTVVMKKIEAEKSAAADAASEKAMQALAAATSLKEAAKKAERQFERQQFEKLTRNSKGSSSTNKEVTRQLKQEAGGQGDSKRQLKHEAGGQGDSKSNRGKATAAASHSQVNKARRLGTHTVSNKLTFNA